MVRIRAMLLLKGQGFSPAAVEKRMSIALKDKREPDETNGPDSRGLETLRYGSATLELGHQMTNWCEDRAFLEWLAVVRADLDAFRRAGATEIVFHFDVGYRLQCNLEFSLETLDALADLGIPMTVRFYRDASIDVPDCRTSDWNSDMEGPKV